MQSLLSKPPLLLTCTCVCLWVSFCHVCPGACRGQRTFGLLVKELEEILSHPILFKSSKHLNHWTVSPLQIVVMYTSKDTWSGWGGSEEPGGPAISCHAHTVICSDQVTCGLVLLPCPTFLCFASFADGWGGRMGTRGQVVLSPSCCVPAGSHVSLLLLLPDARGVIRTLTGRMSFFLLEGFTLPVLWFSQIVLE